jgi:23S rRNA (guanosine2251-2'-O)-methyltransferase
MTPQPRRGDRGAAARARADADRARARASRSSGAGSGGGGGAAGRGGVGRGGAGRGSVRRAGREEAGGVGAPLRGGRGITERGLGGDQIEGRRAVRELLAAGRRPVRDIWVSDTVEDSPLLAEILELAAEGGVALRRVSRARLDAEAATDAAQGVLAHARALEEVDLEALCSAGDGAPFLMVLDGVTDPQNLGALLRTAEVAGVTGVVLPRRRAAHVTPAVAKAAAGAIEHLPVAVVPGIPAALSVLATNGVWTVGLAGDAEESLWGLELATAPVALVLGAEGTGLSRLARARCDALVSIPQRGRLGSLNVAAAGAIAAFEIARLRS